MACSTSDHRGTLLGTGSQAAPGSIASGPSALPVSIVLADCPAEPNACIRPKAFGRPWSQAERRRSFLHGHADEVAQLDQFGRWRIFSGQSVQGLVNGEHLVRRRAENKSGFVQFDMLGL